jgi:hypothetical protein
LLLATLCIGPQVASSVQAIGLDEIAQQSGLGEPLQLMIPLLTDASDELTGDEFAGECFKVVSAVANDLPQVQWARVALEHRGGRAVLVISTAYPINEPIMRVAVRAGCRVSMSREYTVLFDPVSIEAPMVADAVTEPVEAQAPPVAAPRPVVQRPFVPQRRFASVARTGPSIASKRVSEGVAAPVPPVQPQAAKASDGPRLQVSRSVDDARAAPAKRGTARTAAAEREALKALEEETVVLERRVAELSLTMEQMDLELKAARAAKAEAEKAARAATEQARAATAAATPWSMLRVWAEENWPLPVVFPALILLIAAMLLGQQRRGATRVPASITGTPTDAFDSTYVGDPSLFGSLTAGAGVAAPGPKGVDTKANVITSIAPTPSAPVPEFHHGPERTFDYEVVGEYSGYSTLEREQPSIVARLTSAWGTQKAVEKVQDYLLTPRRGGRALSRGAIAELKLLQAIALEHVAGQDSEMLARAGDGKPSRV